MPLSVLQHALVGGELSPSVHARGDLDRYRTSLARIENFVTMPTGGSVFREGLEFVGQTPSGSKVELVPFRSGTDQHYLLELSDRRMRVIYRGGYIASPELPAESISITLTMTGIGPSDVKRASRSKAFTIADIGKVLWAGTSPTDILTGFSATILAVDDLGRAILAYGPFDVQVDPLTTNYWAVTTNASAPTIAISVETPWAYSDLSLLTYAQSADVLTVCHPDYPPHHIKRVSDYEWSVEPAPVVNGPFGPWNTDESKSLKLSKDAVTGVVTGTFASPCVPPEMVGAVIDVTPETGPDHWQADRVYVATTVVKSEGKFYKAETDGTSGTLRPSHTAGTFSDGGVKWKFISRSSTSFRINAVSSIASDLGSVVTLVPLNEEVPWLYTTGSVTLPNTKFSFDDGDISSPAAGSFTLTLTGHGLTVGAWLQGDLEAFNAVQLFHDVLVTYKNVSVYVLSSSQVRVYWSDTRNLDNYLGRLTITGGYAVTQAGSALAGVTTQWRFGAWSDYHGWPSTVTYYQQRQVFGGNYDQPQTLWFSRVNAYTDFGVEFPRGESDAFDLVLGADERTSICGLLSMGRLMVFTTGGEWVVGTAESGAAVTLETARASKQCSWGSQLGVPPQIVGDASVFVQAQGRSVRDLDYDYTKDRFIGNDLTLAVGHLFKGRRVVDWAYQKSPNSVIWCVLDNGTVVGLTYLREQEVAAWHRFVTDGFVERVEVVDEGDDRVYFVVKRNIILGGTSFTASINCEAQSYGGTRIPAPIVVESTTPVFAAGSVGRTITFTVGDVTLTKEIVRYVSSTRVECEDYYLQLSASGVSCSMSYEARYVERMALPEDDAWLDCWSRVTGNMSSITGLAHLEGESVLVQQDSDTVLGPFTVASGAITIHDAPTPQSHTYTVGLPYTGKLRTLDIDLNSPETSRNTQKLVTSVDLLVRQQRFPFKAGASEAALFEPLGSIEQTEDGLNIVRIDITNTWEQRGRVTIIHDKPGPLEVLGIIPVVTLGGA